MMDKNLNLGDSPLESNSITQSLYEGMWTRKSWNTFFIEVGLIILMVVIAITVLAS